MTALTQAELERAFRQVFVSKEVYDRDLHEIRADIREIKENQRWQTRGLISILIAIVAQIVIFVVQMGPVG